MLMRATLPLAQAGTAPAHDTCSMCQVRDKALFSVLPTGSLDLASVSIAHLRLQPGDSVYRQGTDGTAVFTLRRGIVRFERVTSDGQRRIVRLVGEGALIGQESLLQRPYADDAVACTPVEVCRIPRTLVDEFGRQDPVLHQELMRRWQAALESAGEWTAELTCGTARRRVLKLLQQLRRLSPDGSTIWLPSRLEMSDMVGLAVETASRVVSRLRREGVLESRGLVQARLHSHKLQEALAVEDD